MRSTPAPLLALLPALVSLALGCDRRLEPWVDPADEPPRAAKPVRIPGLAQPAPDPMPTAGSAAPGGAPIRGSVRLAEGARAPSDAVLFVIARSAQGGPPLAVRRLPAGPFPLDFEIGPQDAMMAGRPFAGSILLSARIDTDGDPMTRAAGDLIALHETPLEPGAGGVDLVLAPPAQ
jgi:cytochrome c-type biogenesis protein CcmH